MLRATYDKPENDFVLNWGRQCSRRRLLSGGCHVIPISLLFMFEIVAIQLFGYGFDSLVIL